MQQRTSRPTAIAKLPFEESTARFLDSLPLRPNADPITDGLDAFRKTAEQMQREATCPVPTGITTEDCEIAVRDGAKILAQIYRPTNLKRASRPVLCYFHGGAWVIGGIKEYQGICSHLCRFGDVIVASIAYRLAPAHKFPTAVNDCFDAVSWVAENIKALNGDIRKIGVAGDSAGGNLAAAICQIARDQGGPPISRQLLFNPGLAPRNSAIYPSRNHFGGEGNFLTEESYQYFCNLYTRDELAEQDPRRWPILHEDLSSLPDAYIVTAEFDMLRDEGRAYAELLEKHGAQVIYREYKGTIHAFINFAGEIEPGLRALDEAADYLRNWWLP